MHRMILGAAAACTALTSPALARDGQAYIGIDGGAVFPMGWEFEQDGAADDTREIFVEGDNGWEGAALYGYDFGLARVEVEGGYKTYGVEGLVAPVELLPDAGTDMGYRTYSPADGRMTILSAMLNGLVDLGGETGIGAYFGGGLGVARVDAEVAAGASAARYIDDRDAGLAFQGLAGLRVPVSRRVDLGLKYRYFNVGELRELRFSDAGARNLSTKLDTHSVLASLVFNLGGAPEPMAQPAPPPPAPAPAPAPTTPPPPAPPPPPATPVRCTQGPYIVFFEWDEAQVTPEAGTILDSAMTAYESCGSVPIMLAGYTDSSGTAQYNQGLAARRNESVRQYLTSRGIPAARITSEAFGEANPRVPTADGVRELQNRRVEITYGPGSGM